MRTMPDLTDAAWAEAVREAERAFERSGVCAEGRSRRWVAASHPGAPRVAMMAAWVREGARVEIEQSRAAPSPWPKALAVLCWPVAVLCWPVAVLLAVLLRGMPASAGLTTIVWLFVGVPLAVVGAATAMEWARVLRFRRAAGRVLDAVYAVAYEQSAVEVAAEEMVDGDLPVWTDASAMHNQWLDDDEIDWLAAEPRVARVVEPAEPVVSRRPRRRSDVRGPGGSTDALADLSDLWALLRDADRPGEAR
jgi:hypothetical protein